MSDRHEPSATFPWAGHDPKLEFAALMIAEGDVEPAWELLQTTRDDPHRRELAARVLGENGIGQLDLLQQFAENRPDDPEAWLLLGNARCAAGWRIRGGKRAHETPTERFRGLFEHTGRARSVLYHAAELLPADPVPWSTLMRCAMGRQAYQDEIGDLFEQVIRRVPDLYGAHVTRLQSLTRKWYGSQPEVEEFARKASAGLPAGHPLHALSAYAQIEAIVDFVAGRFARARALVAFLFRRPPFGAGPDAASDLLLQQSSEFASHPRLMEAHQAFAAVYHLLGRTERLRRHLEHAGARPAMLPWAYFGDPYERFAEARRAAGLG
ncbi:MAG TPA: hypothetical protein VIL00_04030 [Pseudonocardiaceae bacterium]